MKFSVALLSLASVGFALPAPTAISMTSVPAAVKPHIVTMKAMVKENMGNGNIKMVAHDHIVTMIPAGEVKKVVSKVPAGIKAKAARRVPTASLDAYPTEDSFTSGEMVSATVISPPTEAEMYSAPTTSDDIPETTPAIMNSVETTPTEITETTTSVMKNTGEKLPIPSLKRIRKPARRAHPRPVRGRKNNVFLVNVNRLESGQGKKSSPKGKPMTYHEILKLKAQKASLRASKPKVRNTTSSPRVTKAHSKIAEKVGNGLAIKGNREEILKKVNAFRKTHSRALRQGQRKPNAPRQLKAPSAPRIKQASLSPKQIKARMMEIANFKKANKERKQGKSNKQASDEQVDGQWVNGGYNPGW